MAAVELAIVISAIAKISALFAAKRLSRSETILRVRKQLGMDAAGDGQHDPTQIGGGCGRFACQPGSSSMLGIVWRDLVTVVSRALLRTLLPDEYLHPVATP
jgi:hypothetical protein